MLALALLPRPAIATVGLGLGAADRVLVIAPHPDDETVAAGGLVHQLTAAGAAVSVVYLTYGDGWDWAAEVASGDRTPTDADYVALGRLRHQEALVAGAALGVPINALTFLGFPDGGLDRLWSGDWNGAPVPSPHTRAVTVPYNDALSPGALYTGESIVRLLVRVLTTAHPTTVLVPHPGDAHPDHASAPRFLAVALKRLRGQGILPRKVRVWHYLVHHPTWPVAATVPHEPMIPPTRAQVPATRWTVVPLDDADLAAKTAALDAHHTQLASSPNFLRNFLRRTELFGRVQSKVLLGFAAGH